MPTLQGLFIAIEAAGVAFTLIGIVCRVFRIIARLLTASINENFSEAINVHRLMVNRNSKSI